MLLAAGDVDDSIFIVASGVIRHCYFSGDKEVTPMFSTRGTMFISYHCFYFGKPSFYQIEACCDGTSVIVIPKAYFNKMIRSSHEFALWMLSAVQGQMFAFEYKNVVINGTAEERYTALVQNRPEILKNVSLRIIASYLGITQQYLSVLRKRITNS